jgi:hypothetical protein
MTGGPFAARLVCGNRLATMPVRIRYLNVTSPDAWKGDWPLVTPAREHSKTERPEDAQGKTEDMRKFCFFHSKTLLLVRLRRALDSVNRSGIGSHRAACLRDYIVLSALLAVIRITTVRG